jgi:hypothetical protein
MATGIVVRAVVFVFSAPFTVVTVRVTEPTTA